MTFFHIIKTNKDYVKMVIEMYKIEGKVTFIPGMKMMKEKKQLEKLAENDWFLLKEPLI